MLCAKCSAHVNDDVKGDIRTNQVTRLNGIIKKHANDNRKDPESYRPIFEELLKAITNNRNKNKDEQEIEIKKLLRAFDQEPRKKPNLTNEEKIKNIVKSKANKENIDEYQDFINYQIETTQGKNIDHRISQKIREDFRKYDYWRDYYLDNMSHFDILSPQDVDKTVIDEKLRKRHH